MTRPREGSVLSRGEHAGDALAFLQAVYRDVTLPIRVRLKAAKAAIRYEKPALARVEMRGEVSFTVHHVPLMADEWSAEVAGRT